MEWIELAKSAHRAVCPMINCVDCLFGICDNDCEYQISFAKELDKMIKEHEQRNDNQRAMHGM